MIDAAGLFLLKAEESLAGAESELANGRYNNCANRCYYACSQVAIAALINAGVHPSGGDQAEWGHAFVQARFSDLINRCKLYLPALRDTLSRALMLRHTADYETDPVNRTQAQRSLDRARAFVTAIRQ